MAESLFNKVYNPDVLSCLANLSNDEVFTPPEIVNQSSIKCWICCRRNCSKIPIRSF